MSKCGRHFGMAPYQGYEFQIQATVYLGLKLMMEREVPSIVVEPASGEDISAELLLANPEDADARLRIPVGSHEIQIQIKLRQSGHWTPAEFRRVLQGAPGLNARMDRSTRTWPVQFLQENPESRFVLFTNAQVNSQLQDFAITDIGDKRPATQLPEVSIVDPVTMAPRIGILAQQTPEIVLRKACGMLESTAYVPGRHATACIQALENAVRDRLLARRPSIWPREEVLDTIRRFHGYPTSATSNRLVKPSNYDVLRGKLSTQNALIIVGTPGSGKSFVAEALGHELRLQGYDLIQVDPRSVSTMTAFLDDPHKTVFYIEDPWGHYRMEDHAATWIKELPKLLGRVNTNKKILVTSRIGLASEAFGPNPPSTVLAAVTQLTDEHYDRTARVKILHNEKAALDSAKQDFIALWQHRIVKELRIPYALTMFVHRVSATKEAPDIAELLKASQIEFIGNTLAQEIKAGGPGAIASAALLWLLFMLGKTSSEAAGALREYAVMGGAPATQLDPRGLLDKLLAAGWFERRGQHVIAHPTQVEGLESLLHTHVGRTVSEDSLRATLVGLMKSDRLQYATKVAKQLASRRLQIPRTVQNAIDRFVVQRCLDAEPVAVSDALRDVETLSRGDDPVSLIVHAVHARSQPGSGFMPTWQRPDWPEPMITSVRQSADAKKVAAMFVRYVLPHHRSYDYDAVPLLEFMFSDLGWDLSAECAAGLDDALDYGNGDCDALLHGAMHCGEPGFDHFLDKAFSSLDAIVARWTGPTSRYRQAEQKELDVAEASYLVEQPGEDLWAPREVIQMLLRARRQREGFQWILSHPRRVDLLEAWVAEIRHGAVADELQAIWSTCPPTDRRLAWKAIHAAQAREWRHQLIQEIPSSSPEWYRDLILALGAILEDIEWQTECLSIVSSLPLDRRLIFARHCLHINHDSSTSCKVPQAVVTAMFSEEERYIANVLLADGAPDGEPGNVPVNQLRELVLSNYSHVALAAISLLAGLGVSAWEALQQLLVHDDESVRAKAAELAANPLFADLRDDLRRLLNDPDYRVRQASMISLAAHADDKDQRAIMAMYQDRSGPVRETCASLIGYYRWSDGVPALIALLADRRDSNASGGLFREEYVGGPQYLVARAAAQAFGQLDGLPQEALVALHEFLRGGAARCDDVFVRYYAMQSVAMFPDASLVPFLGEFLLDPQHGAGVKNAGYPVRYAAAWGLVSLLCAETSTRAACECNVLLKPALHSDGRLAGPCLLSLGLLLPRSAVECCNALPIGISAERVAAVLVGACIADVWQPELLGGVAAPEPLLILLKKVRERPSWATKDWTQWGKASGVGQWLDAISNTDVGTSLLWGLGQLCPSLFESPPQTPVAKHLPEPMRVITTQTLADPE